MAYPFHLYPVVDAAFFLSTGTLGGFRERARRSQIPAAAILQ
jgi:hypothetical protein